MHKYLVRVLVVLLHACYSVVGPIPFLLAAIFSPGHPYIGSTTVLQTVGVGSFNQAIKKTQQKAYGKAHL